MSEGSTNLYFTNARADARIAAADTDVIKRLKGAQFKTVSPDGEISAGVEVLDIKPGSPAAGSGLEVGDIIVSINREEVADLDDMKAIVKAAEEVLLIKLVRNERSLFLVVQ